MDFVAVERFGRPNSFGRENSAEADLFPGSTGTVGPFRYKIGRSRPFLSLFVRRANGFCRAIDQSGRAAIPSRLDRTVEICSAKITLRVRGQCFGADCVFTPFSPSILS
ncbi:unnamed protein product [Microthlaspi erraticum]|uniref:Uncharacterized protein n=1 Tax=Microthlaspi erraticum TaxID=1685480 RepID=A0A6D2HXJ6_9BRAS|nr:unnamed protein product [Microthlaspi erraticum]